jgi:DNA-binding winged helix-turn-helix (wHTH) protein
MTDSRPGQRYRFGVFEVDAALGELRRQGVRVKLNTQPFQVLHMLLERPGEVLTREEISQQLWPDGTFVDYEHGVNSAINRIREALGDKAGSARFVETLARRGYRFVAPVERIAIAENSTASLAEPAYSSDAEPDSSLVTRAVAQAAQQTGLLNRILAAPEDLPKASHRTVQMLFVGMQCMYVGFYVGALANLAEIEDLFSPLPRASLALNLLIVTAAILIPVRASLLTAVLFHAPGAREKILKIWPFLLAFDELWALAPFLLLHHINYGLALACTTLLVYAPFAQRSLLLMGAGGADVANSAAPEKRTVASID